MTERERRNQPSLTPNVADYPNWALSRVNDLSIDEEEREDALGALDYAVTECEFAPESNVTGEAIRAFCCPVSREQATRIQTTIKALHTPY